MDISTPEDEIKKPKKTTNYTKYAISHKTNMH